MENEVTPFVQTSYWRAITCCICPVYLLTVASKPSTASSLLFIPPYLPNVCTVRGTELHYRVQNYNRTVLSVLTDLGRNSVVFKVLFCIYNRTMNKQKFFLIQMQLLNFLLHPS